MSRSNAPKQDTINTWVNWEAVDHYAKQFDSRAERIEAENWLKGLTPEQSAVVEACHAAAKAVREANELAHQARMQSDDVFYDRIYRRPA
jgi:hypothetical protein